ncbi:hypothetical protein HHI36_021617, partial [Cryptolaemus montrouzieri]
EVLNEINDTSINQCPEIAPDHFILNIDRKPTGKYGIPVKILKAVANEIAGPLTHIVNLMVVT